MNKNEIITKSINILNKTEPYNKDDEIELDNNDMIIVEYNSAIDIEKANSPPRVQEKARSPPRVQEKICFVNISDNIMYFAAYIYSFCKKKDDILQNT